MDRLTLHSALAIIVTLSAICHPISSIAEDASIQEIEEKVKGLEELGQSVSGSASVDTYLPDVDDKGLSSIPVFVESGSQGGDSPSAPSTPVNHFLCTQDENSADGLERQRAKKVKECCQQGKTHYRVYHGKKSCTLIAGLSNRMQCDQDLYTAVVKCEGEPVAAGWCQILKNALDANMPGRIRQVCGIVVRYLEGINQLRNGLNAPFNLMDWFTCTDECTLVNCACAQPLG